MTTNIFPPEVSANPTGYYLAEVRRDGWLMDYKHFSTEQEARTWADNHTGEASTAAANKIADMIQRWANK